MKKGMFDAMVDISLNVLLSVSVLVLGFYVLKHNEPLSLLPYQIALSIMFISGMWLYKGSDGKIAFVKDVIKNCIILILGSIVLVFLSGRFDSDGFKSTLGGIFHLPLIIALLAYMKFHMKKLCGDKAYITMTGSLVLLPILLIIFHKAPLLSLLPHNLAVVIAIVLALGLMEPINFRLYKKEIQKNKKIKLGM